MTTSTTPTDPVHPGRLVARPAPRVQRHGSHPSRPTSHATRHTSLLTRHSSLVTRHSASPAFSLVELIVGSSIAGFVLVGVLAAFLMLGRSGVNVAAYADAEAQLRRGLEDFSQDVRMASGIVWNSGSSITLTVPNNYTSTSNQVTYAYDSATTGATARSFYRVPGGPASTAARTVYVRNVSSFTFARYNRLDASAGNDAETKRIQIQMNVRTSASTLVAANTTGVSASFLLRNKVAN